MHQIPYRGNLHSRNVGKSVALSFFWVPTFAGMTAPFAKVPRTGEGTRSSSGFELRKRLRIGSHLLRR